MMAGFYFKRIPVVRFSEKAEASHEILIRIPHPFLDEKPVGVGGFFYERAKSKKALSEIIFANVLSVEKSVSPIRARCCGKVDFQM